MYEVFSETVSEDEDIYKLEGRCRSLNASIVARMEDTKSGVPCPSRRERRMVNDKSRLGPLQCDYGPI